MTRQRKIRRVGNSLGLTLPKEMLDDLHLGDGAEVTVVRTPDGILVAPSDPDFDETMAAYEVVARKYRNALRELAK